MLQTGTQMSLQADEPQEEEVDKKSTDQGKQKDKKLKVWAKIIYSQAQQAKPGDFYFTSEKSFSEINCSTRTLKVLQRFYYDSDGNEIKHIHYGGNDKYEAIAPDTTSESVYNFSCAFKKALRIPAKKTKDNPVLRAKTTSAPLPAKQKKAKKSPLPKMKSPSKPSAKPESKCIDTKQVAR